jgi:pyruvate/2-oxoglutarate dehydrogenase complex dihydrolipoamide acyltransferase (E2) component
MTIRMPKLNETGENGIVADVLVKVGDEVQQGQPVLSIEMEKAIVEIESPYRGVVGKINVKNGDEVAIEDALIELEASQG